MTKQIALFNHKGGVSKTTTTFNLGWMLANKGKTVMLVDCDPQCNLTGMVLGLRGSEAFAAVYESESGEVRNIRDGLAPAFESRPVPLEPVVCEPVKGQSNMYLLPGHIGFAEYEVVLGLMRKSVKSMGIWLFNILDRIADAIRLFSSCTLWISVASELNLEVEDVKTELQLIVNRRNQIAHEADLDSRTPGGNRFTISPSDTERIINFIQDIGEAIYVVVN